MQNREDCPYAKDIEKISEIITDVVKNQSEIDKLTNGDWYSNQELFEMFQEMKQDFSEFNDNFHKYNGLIEDRRKDRELLEKIVDKYDQIEGRISAIETKRATKKETTKSIFDYIAYIIATILGLKELMFLFS